MRRREGRIVMINEIDMDMDMVLISIYNAQAVKKIYFNDADFINSTFENPYDAAWAVSLSGKWARSDDYVYFDNNGCITSFTHWDDENSPIDLNKLDIGNLINSLKRWHKNKNRYVVNNIPRAIHDALQE